MAFIAVALNWDVSLLLERIVHSTAVFKPDDPGFKTLKSPVKWKKRRKQVCHRIDLKSSVSSSSTSPSTCLVSMDLLTRHRQEFLADLQWNCTGNTLYRLLKFEEMNTKQGIKALFGTCSKECETEEDPKDPSTRPHPSCSPTLTLTLLHDQPKSHPYSSETDDKESCLPTKQLPVKTGGVSCREGSTWLEGHHPTHPLTTWVLGSAQVRRSTTYLPWSAAAYNVYRPFPAGYLLQTNYTFNLYYLGQLHFGSVRGSSSSILLQISEMNVFLQTLAITGLLIKSGLTQDN